MDDFPSPEPTDPRLEAMAQKVLEETIITEGDGTIYWALKVTRLLSRVAKKHQCFEAFYDAVIKGDPKTRCCPAHNEKLIGNFGRAIMCVLRAFRFPVIRYESQVKSILTCRHAFNSHSRNVCLNPYHYRWVELPTCQVPPIIVNKELDYGEPPIRTEDALDDWNQKDLKEEQVVASWDVPNVTMRGDEIKLLYDRYAAENGDFQYMNYGNFGSFDGSPCSSTTMSLGSSFASLLQQSNRQDDEEPGYYRSGLSSPASHAASPREFIPNGNDTISLDQEMMDDSEVSDIMHSENFSSENNGNRKPTYADGRPITPIEPRPLYRSSALELGDLSRQAGIYECVEYEESPSWLKLIYYEEGTMIGEKADVEGHHCLIDGFTASRTDSETRSRFSLGWYNNPNRSPQTAEVRGLIGKGVRFYLLAGEVYVENLCNIPVFVQSIGANMKNGFQLNTVSKLPPTGTMKVFDMRLFSKQLRTAAEKTYQDVYCLSRMCTVRVSFCKGWGEHYRRSTVLRSPVWFQAHLNNPMHWVDSVLTCMGAPPRICSSRT